MNTPDPHHKKFQLDRIVFFSDAVYAIAITLLVIEIKIPELSSDLSDSHLLDILGESIGKFIGVFISFLVIGRYWIAHHRWFGHVVNYNSKLLWTNLWLLLSVILMPFSTGIFSAYWMSSLITPVYIYVLNICFTGFMNIRLINLISNPKYHLSEGLQDRNLIRFFRARSLIAPSVFIIAAIVAIFDTRLAYYTPVLIPLVSLLVNRYHRKKHPEFFIEK